MTLLARMRFLLIGDSIIDPKWQRTSLAFSL